tara:strand:- start:523 stop:648 length:126 start_codon:yes stop_codon:yes gene_type:complete
MRGYDVRYLVIMVIGRRALLVRDGGYRPPSVILGGVVFAAV